MTEQELREQREHLALRDQFAAAALTGLLATTHDADSRFFLEAEASRTGVTCAETVADLAYTCADAMLARRAQPPADAPAPSTAQTAPSA